MSLWLLLVAVGLFVDGDLARSAVRISFIEPRVCLDFDVVCNSTDFEARLYNQTFWVGTSFSGFRDSQRRLAAYTQGQNADGLVFNSTAQFLASFDVNGESDLYLLLPEGLQGNAPIPNDSLVFLTNFSEQFIYSKTVKTPPKRLKRQVEKFNQTLAQDNVNYLNSVYFVAHCWRKGNRNGNGNGCGNRNRNKIVKANQGGTQMSYLPVGSFRSPCNNQVLPTPISDLESVLGDELTERPTNFPEGNQRKRNPGRQKSRRSFEIWFKSIGFPDCPIAQMELGY
ncbi:uncharacterized protein [Chiloscyllium punctatum]|uniref:uncharacterized protein n=1 Tax=Chiloscyllium punctatum TaxID=137246 RepID=UPI003B635C64